MVDASGRSVADAAVAWSSGTASGWLVREGDGVYRGPVAPGDLRLVAQAPGFADAYAARPVVAGERADVEIRFTQGGGLVVTVRDEDGAPVGGASVQLFGGGSAIPRAVTRAKSDGVARFPRQPAGPATVAATAPGFELARAETEVREAEDVPVAIALRREDGVAAIVSGVVVDRAGRPAGGAVVGAFRVGVGAAELARATAAADGGFRIDATGREADASGRPVELRVVEPPALATTGQGTLLASWPRAAGVVVRAGARPRLALRLVFPVGGERPRSASVEGFNATTRTGGFVAAASLGPDGAVVFELDLARYEELLLKCEGHAPAFLGPLDFSTGAADPEPREVALARPARAVGLVVGSDGGAAAGASVVARFGTAAGHLSFSVIAMASSGGDGRFELDGLPADCTLTVEVRGLPARRIELGGLAPGETRPVEVRFDQ